MSKHFGEVVVAYLNGVDMSVEKLRSKLCVLHERKEHRKRLEDIVNHPNFISLDHIDKHVRLHEIVQKIKDKEQSDTAFISGYDEAIEIFRSLNYQ